MMASDPESVPFTLVSITESGEMSFQVVQGRNKLMETIQEWGIKPIDPKKDYEPQPGYLAADAHGDPVIICRGLPTKLNFHLSISPYEAPEEPPPPAPLKARSVRSEPIGGESSETEAEEIEDDDWD